MKLRETCGCGASIEIDGVGPFAGEVAMGQIDSWRSNHKHVLCRPESPQSDEQAVFSPVIPERDPRSSTELRLDFGFVPTIERPMEAM